MIACSKLRTNWRRRRQRPGRVRRRRPSGESPRARRPRRALRLASAAAASDLRMAIRRIASAGPTLRPISRMRIRRPWLCFGALMVSAWPTSRASQSPHRRSRYINQTDGGGPGRGRAQAPLAQTVGQHQPQQNRGGRDLVSPRKCLGLTCAGGERGGTAEALQGLVPVLVQQRIGSHPMLESGGFCEVARHGQRCASVARPHRSRIELTRVPAMLWVLCRLRRCAWRTSGHWYGSLVSRGMDKRRGRRW
jgi:hypothetical protein